MKQDSIHMVLPSDLEQLECSRLQETSAEFKGRWIQSLADPCFGFVISANCIRAEHRVLIATTRTYEERWSMKCSGRNSLSTSAPHVGKYYQPKQETPKFAFIGICPCDFAELFLLKWSRGFGHWALWQPHGSSVVTPQLIHQKSMLTELEHTIR